MTLINIQYTPIESGFKLGSTALSTTKGTVVSFINSKKVVKKDRTRNVIKSLSHWSWFGFGHSPG